jgi:3' exoribonuclease, RNase T-like
MSETHVMIDLETMARATNSVMCSIGAVKFTIEEGIIDKFYCTVDAKDCKKYGLVVEQGTLDWWKGQPKHVLQELLKNNLLLKDALKKFSLWYGPKSLPTWGNGVAFDNVILRNAYEAVGMSPPWKHWEDRCYRTMKNIIAVAPPAREGDLHNALDDAIFQAEHLRLILGS